MKKSKKTNKNKIRIPAIILIIVIILIIIVELIIPNIIKEKTPPLTEERAQELLYGSYIYYLMTSGNVPTANRKLAHDGVPYQVIDIDIKSLKEVNNIIEDSFSKPKAFDLIENIYSNPEIKFAESSDRIFISKVIPDENCKDLKLDGKLEISKKADYYYIKYYFGDLSYAGEKAVYEDGNWVLMSPITVCKLTKNTNDMEQTVSTSEQEKTQG